MCFKVKQQYYRREEARRALEAEGKIGTDPIFPDAKLPKNGVCPYFPAQADKPREQAEPLPV